MIEAGLPLLYAFHRESHLAEETVREIFLSMKRAWIRRSQDS
jgi:hypothetical protein